MIAADRQIAREAHALGFSLVGCAPLDVLPREEFLAAWLADGRAGEMRYLERRQAERARSATGAGRGRARSSRSAFRTSRRRRRAATGAHELRGRVAAYALGRDYHDRDRRPAPQR